LASTSPTSCGCSVGIVRLRTNSHGVSLLFITYFTSSWDMRRSQNAGCSLYTKPSKVMWSCRIYITLSLQEAFNDANMEDNMKNREIRNI
jgi:hypothetical protein